MRRSAPSPATMPRRPIVPQPRQVSWTSRPTLRGRTRPARSEVRLRRVRNWNDVVAVKADIALFAEIFLERTRNLFPALHAGPRHIEGARIVDRHRRLQDVSALDEFPAFDNVDLVGVRRAVIVHESLVVEPDR